MAKKPKRGSYLNLEDVRVFYDAKSDTVSLTSGDRDLPEAGGLKIDISPGTQAERQLRELLKAKDVIRWDPWPKVTREDTFDRIVSSLEERLQLGTNISGEAVEWDLNPYRNLWIHGATGGGASFLSRAAIQHGFVHGWEVYGIDPRQVELTEISQYPVGRTVAKNTEDTLTLLDSLIRLSEERLGFLESQDALSIRELSEELQPRKVLLVIDSVEILLESASPEGQAKLLTGLERLTWVAGPVGIHVLLSSKAQPRDLLRADVDKLKKIQNICAHIVCGNYYQDQLPEDLRDRYRPNRGRGMGRAQFVLGGPRLETTEFQLGLALDQPLEFIEALRAYRRGY